MLALAGELATEYGITGWPKGAVIEAAAIGFKAWQSTRGRGNDERRQILHQISGFIERHGDSRFSYAGRADVRDSMRFNRAGWWRDEAQGRIYLFNKDGLHEALKGFDFKRALDCLQEAGGDPAGSGERSKTFRHRGAKAAALSYSFGKLEGDHVA